MSDRPRWLLLSAEEQRVERVHGFGVVHSYEPLGPCEILDGITGVSRLPIGDAGHSIVLDIEQHVLRSKVTMHDDRAVTVEPRYRSWFQGLQGSEGRAYEPQHLRGVAVLDQILTVSTGHEAESQSRMAEVNGNDLGDRQMIYER